jgi:isoquinoline 1-oxidoreductase beta subunit
VCTWALSREDDIHFDYYNAVAGMYMKAVTDAQGRPTAWLQRSVFPPIGSTFDASARYGADGELAQGWVDLPFDIPNLRAENGPAQNHVRIGWVRSVANIYHAFAIQSFIDELAVAAGRDRIEFFWMCWAARARSITGVRARPTPTMGNPSASIRL